MKTSPHSKFIPMPTGGGKETKGDPRLHDARDCNHCYNVDEISARANTVSNVMLGILRHAGTPPKAPGDGRRGD